MAVNCPAIANQRKRIIDRSLIQFERVLPENGLIFRSATFSREFGCTTVERG
jgi:hypothetical protein